MVSGLRNMALFGVSRVQYIDCGISTVLISKTLSNSSSGRQQYCTLKFLAPLAPPKNGRGSERWAVATRYWYLVTAKCQSVAPRRIEPS